MSTATTSNRTTATKTSAAFFTPLADEPHSDRVAGPSAASRRRILALAKHEYRAAARSRILLVLLGILIIVTAASVYVASVEYRSQLADYEAYRSAAVAGGITQIAPSPLAPLSLLRGAIEYLEIIGAVIAIALGYLTISRERSNRTLPLLLSRPVTTGELATGGLLGALGVIATLVAASTAVGLLSVGLIGNDWIGPAQALKVLLAGLAAIVYMGCFYCLGAMITARSKTAANGLMIALAVWMVVVLVLPQIGDTLDADNQLPGGLFSALGLDRNGETQILTHFTGYETIRTGIEELSLAKHYERLAFAMADVPVKYRGFSLGQLLGEKVHDLLWLAAYPIAAIYGLRQSFRFQSTSNQGSTS